MACMRRFEDYSTVLLLTIITQRVAYVILVFFLGYTLLLLWILRMNR